MAPNFEHLNTYLPGAALKATRNAALLPADIGFHKSMDSDFAADLDEFSSKVLSLTNRLLELSSTIDSSGKGKGKLLSEDVQDSFESCVVDRIDLLLERVDICLDEHSGKIKAPAIAINPIAEKKRPTGKTLPGQAEAVVQHAAHFPKPQLLFKVPVDNSNSPWYPRLRHKYHAQVPLGFNFTEREDEESTNASLTHPYRYEIKHLSYPASMFQAASPIPPKPFETTSFTWVDTPDALKVMLNKLLLVTEIAVDLEHHNYRTYAGFLCLMQLSTRDEDWIVDTIALRDHLEPLNEVFSNPKIMKVFHGADSDIIWLQQDLNLYVVNLFDTYQASKTLSFPKHGLAHLLEMYCDFTPDKRYQLADWRVRPLSDAMLRYARSDTHFLLYIYDNLRNALLDRGESQARASEGGPSSFSTDSFVREVLARSEETALKVYEKDIYDAAEGSGSAGWDNLARKWNKIALISSAPNAGGNSMQKHVYKAVHAWRDQVAREEDESTRYVLPNHFLFQLAEGPPADMPALLRIFYSPPPVIRRRARELLDAIRDAVAGNANLPSVVPAEGHAMEVEDVPKIVEPSLTSSSLWSKLSTPSFATKSSLFGSSLSVTKVPVSTLVTSTSSLFGASFRVTPSNTPTAGAFQDVLNKIHSSLSITPQMPKASTSIIDENQTVEQNDDACNDLEMHAEVAFVPAAQRTKKEVVEDSLVIVGQTRQKKRKRTTTQGITSAKKSKVSPGPSTVKEEDEKPFDFSSVPNVLDQVPSIHEDNKMKRKGKQKKGGTGYSYGDFPAPPKGHSELKSGNQSYTFKK